MQLSRSEPNIGLSLHYVNPDVTLEDALAKGVPSDSMILEAQDGPERYLVLKDGQTLGPHIISAAASFQDGRPIVAFRLDVTGGKIMGAMTAQGIGKRLAIVLDDKVYSAPVIQAPILGGSGIITGSFSFAEAIKLARRLESSR
jgi:preprotein translocase subunit SecD